MLGSGSRAASQPDGVCDLAHTLLRPIALMLVITGDRRKTMPHHQEKFDQDVLAARQRLIEQLNALNKAFQG